MQVIIRVVIQSEKNLKILKKERNIIIIFLLLLLISGSCRKVSDQDHSLTAEEYSNLGLPDPTRIWNSKDYVDAYGALDMIKVMNPLSLPKKDSEKSGKYFNRIIDLDNLSFLLDESLSLNDRAYQIQAYINIQGSLINVYTDLENTEQYYNRELIDLYIFSLSITQNMLDLGYRINESVVDDDLEIQYAFNSIQYLYITMVLFVLDNQKKSSIFEETDLERLSDFLSNSVLENRDWMDTVATKDIKQRLREVIENTSSEQIKKKYDHLIESM